MNEQEKRNYRPDFELLWGCWDHNRMRRTPRLAAREPEAEILNFILLSNFPLIYILMSYIILSDQKVQRRSWYSFPFLPSNESLDVLTLYTAAVLPCIYNSPLHGIWKEILDELKRLIQAASYHPPNIIKESSKNWTGTKVPILFNILSMFDMLASAIYCIILIIWVTSFKNYYTLILTDYPNSEDRYSFRPLQKRLHVYIYWRVFCLVTRFTINLISTYQYTYVLIRTLRS